MYLHGGKSSGKKFGKFRSPGRTFIKFFSSGIVSFPYLNMYSKTAVTLEIKTKPTRKANTNGLTLCKNDILISPNSDSAQRFVTLISALYTHDFCVAVTLQRVTFVGNCKACIIFTFNHDFSPMVRAVNFHISFDFSKPISD